MKEKNKGEEEEEEERKRRRKREKVEEREIRIYGVKILVHRMVFTAHEQKEKWTNVSFGSEEITQPKKCSVDKN